MLRFLAAVTLLLPLLGLHSPAAGAAEPPKSVTIEDWVGDAMAPAGDASSATVSPSSYFTGTTMLSLRVTGPQLGDTFKDPAWESKATAITWDVDTDGDDEVEHTVTLRRVVDRTHGDVMFGEVRPSRDGCGSLVERRSTYEAQVERRCFGDPAFLRTRVRFTYDTGANGVSTDTLPERGWSAPWTEAGATTPRGPAPSGFWLVGTDGGIFSYGAAPFLGSTGAMTLNQPIVGMAGGPDGYWFVAADGGVFAFGGAGFHGSTGDVRLNSPIVGMAATPTGGGYWLVAADGGIFTFGDAAFFGSTGDLRLNQPIVGMAAMPSGQGYWFVARDGGIFSFGDASFFGSAGNLRLAQPIVGITATPDGSGYWFVARDGGIFSYGSARFFGSGAGATSTPVVGIAASRTGDGYRLVYADGRVAGFGNALTYDASPTALTRPLVGGAVHS